MDSLLGRGQAGRLEPDFPPYDADDDLFEAVARDGEPRSRVYAVPATAVVLGRGSRAEVELRLAEVLADGVPVRRRRGGGCAVVLDPGNVVVVAAFRAKGFGGNLEHFDRLGRWLASGLGRIGLRGLGREGTSDLALGGRKVGGSCIHRARDVLLWSSTLLVAPDLALVSRYLAHPPREPAYRRGRSHAEFMGALAPEGGRAAPELAAALSGALAAPPPTGPGARG